MISIFGTESSGSKFLSTTLAVATGAFSAHGEWTHVSSSVKEDEWVYHQFNFRRALSLDGQVEIQHISLPWGWVCNSSEAPSTEQRVDALVPKECFRYQSDPDLDPETAEWKWNRGKRKGQHILEASSSDNDAIAERCRTEAQIPGGFVLYPKRFFVNVTSHLDWYLSRNVSNITFFDPELR